MADEIKELELFLPKKYLYLTKKDKIEYKGMNLKTDYLISIINELLLKYYFQKDDLIDKEIEFNLWSKILRTNYGTKYNYYISYLLDIEFMFMISDYYKNKKARTYKLNIYDHNILDVIKYKVDDTILIKKTSKDFLKKSFLELNNSPIPIDIRSKLVDDLYKIDIDIDSSIKYLNDLKDNREIEHSKYLRNLISIENAGTGNIFFKFDEYGRMHTNFTVLKKHIRQNFITINGMLTDEVDLPNSQPLFLIVLMKQQMSLTNFIKKDVTQYINLVQDGLIYDYISGHSDIKERDDVKTMMFKVLFGHNGDAKKENIIFKRLFPTVFEFIKDYKSVNQDYKSLSHDLQTIESNFIYNKVIRHIMNNYPHIKLFTIHDSITFQKIYTKEVNEIFKYYQRNIINLVF